MAAHKPDAVYINNLNRVRVGRSDPRSSSGTRCSASCTEISAFGRPLRQLAFGVLARGANRFVVGSRFMRDHWVNQGVPSDRVSVVPLGVDPAMYPAGDAEQMRNARDSLNIGGDRFVALYLGRVTPGKGVEVLLEAWEEVIAQCAHAHLLIAGVREPRDEYVRVCSHGSAAVLLVTAQA